MKIKMLFIFLFVLSSFTTLKPTNWQLETKDKPLKILLISDLNAAYGSLTYSEDVPAVISEIRRIKPDIILCGGDMVAGQKSSLTEQNIKEMWQSFKKVVFNPITNLVLL